MVKEEDMNGIIFVNYIVVKKNVVLYICVKIDCGRR